MSPHDPAALSLTGTAWVLQRTDHERLDAALDQGWHPAAARLLASRPLPLSRSAFEPDLSQLHDPYLMCGMDAAIERIGVALRSRQKIRIITDYDVDGTTSSLILQAALRIADPMVALDYHIPDRFTEGYGLSIEGIRKAAKDGVQLIITADIGVRDHEPVAEAKRLGLDVLICDHHLPDGASVPEHAIVLCPPQKACSYPNPHLAACGVATKLAQALLKDHPSYERVLMSLLKLAAIGTVADLVPLVSEENRAIVKLGLGELNEGRHTPGLSALLEVSGVTPGQITEGELGYRIGPRINAAGRIHKATHVIELLSARDPEKARILAAELDQLNTERRNLQEQVAKAALAQIDPDDPPHAVICAGPEDQGWHRGVVGIVASRLKEQTHRFCAVLSIQGEFAVGSVRSVPGVHAVEALKSVSDLLVKFGGHPAAAGFTVPTDRIDEMRQRLDAWVQELQGKDVPAPERTIDAELSVDQVGDRLMADMKLLGPFGQGNPEPTFLLRGVRMQGLRLMGKDADHLKGRVPGHGGRSVDAVWWRAAEHRSTMEGPVDLLVCVQENHWRGRRSLQLRLVDARPAASGLDGDDLL